jgi:hypothetical protein
MRIVGAWYKCDDGLTRPVLLMRVRGGTGSAIDEKFLIDSGADRTVFSATLLDQLGGPTASAPTGLSLAGVGGTQAFVQVAAALELARDDGGTASVRGEFAAFTDPAATDLSILGRDVLKHFDLIFGRNQIEIVLLSGNHRYQILST